VTGIPQLKMRRSLSEPVEIPIWPEGVHLKTFSQSQAAEAHALLELAYAKGGGAVGPFEEWWSSLSTDSEYSPDLCFPAYANGGLIIAIAQCWTSAFVKDFVVHPNWQRRGIGRALLLHVFRVFQARGVPAVDLKVQTNNPSGAVQFYRGLGMQQIS
jgi:ribosomal protein S18 acetylase RimI-like enzyme